MDPAIKNIIYDLFQFRRAKTEATSVFASLKHNSNLCPKFQHKLELVFDAFEKYRRITYDIQGPRDQGSDVLIRQIFNDQPYFICFQIKSEDDLRNKTWLKSIKAQWFDSQTSYHNLLDYYILICCDARDLATKDKIRLIESEFSRIPPVHIIEPEYVLSFLKLSLVQTDAIVKAKLGSEDIVFRNSLSIVSDFTPTENAIFFYLIYKRIYDGDESTDAEVVLNSEFIKYVYTNTLDFDRDWFFEDEEDVDQDLRQEHTIRGLDIRDRLSIDLEALKDLYVRTHDSGGYYVSLQDAQALVVLMMDANERYGYKSDNLLFYMMELFGPHKGYVPPEENTVLS